jgi:hypothetical protein
MLSGQDIQEMTKLLDEANIPFRFEVSRHQITNFLRQWQQMPKGERSSIWDRFGPQHGSRLLFYASRMAEQAVRDHSAEWVELGLLAVALEGTRYDFRYSVVSLCLLYHSAMKINSDPSILFRQAASYGDEGTSDFILGYLAKGEKDIRAMRIEESDGPDGFRYASTGL